MPSPPVHANVNPDEVGLLAITLDIAVGGAYTVDIPCVVPAKLFAQTSTYHAYAVGVVDDEGVGNPVKTTFPAVPDGYTCTLFT